MLARRVDVDRWEEAFDSWTPRAGAAAADETGVDLEKEALLRLARELAERRHAEREQARAELDGLKQALRERAEAIARRERELAELHRRLDEGKLKPARQGGNDVEALVARERATLERARALEARERELERRRAEIEAEAARVRERERALAAELESARAQRGESESERRLATAERERLEERAQEARRIEKELAARRIELERVRQRLEAGVDVPEGPAAGHDLDGGQARAPAAAPADDRDRELRRLEAMLESREHELALMRQGLDADRNALLARERALRRREVAEERRAFEPPFTPPSFSEGLAAFVRSRSRD